MTIRLEQWVLCPADKAGASGEEISKAAYRPLDWTAADVPGTIIGSLVAAGAIPDPRVGTNIETLAGFKGGNEKLHSLMPLPADSPYRKPWWLRTSFNCDRPKSGRRIWLQLRGINYRANVYLNGQRIAAKDEISGIFNRFQIDITETLRKRNALALELTPAGPDEFGHTWIDWAPEPPDNSMGVIQPLTLHETGEVSLSSPFVQTDLDTRTLRSAKLTLRATLQNHSDTPQTTILEAQFADRRLNCTVQLNPRETREVFLRPEKYAALRIRNPRVWWPYQMGKPEMYRLKLTAKLGRRISDRYAVDFGIRKITSRLNKHGARQFTVNGKDILIRGSAYSPDWFLRQSRKKDKLDIAYAKNMHLNAIRLEGTPVSDNFWERCNREGILVLHGITCVNYWEHTADWAEADFQYARRAVGDLLTEIRNHPCLMGFMIASDFPPIPKAETMYLDLLKEILIDVPVTANSAKKFSPQLGPTGMIHGPYDFVPPVFWYSGGAVDFNTECGPDICLPQMQTLRDTFPKQTDRTVGSHAWNMHCGLQLFTSTTSGDTALTKRYGVKQNDLKSFVQLSQIMGYECWRAMYEAWARNHPKSTGVIGWMLNSCWPSLMWQMYDYGNHPLGAFYGTQKACEPIHTQYAYDDETIWAFNHTIKPLENAQVRAALLDPAGQTLWSKQKDLSLNAGSRRKCFTLPPSLKRPTVYFLFLEIFQGQKRIARNVYWLAAQMDTVQIIANGDQKATKRPAKTLADFRAINNLPAPHISTQSTFRKVGSYIKGRVKLLNKSEQVAFFLWPKVVSRKTGRLIAPVYWSENGITLKGGESVGLKVTLPAENINLRDMAITLE